MNYNYPLSANIYKIFSNGDEDFTTWLHNKGYGDTNKATKLFTFSQLYTSYAKNLDGILVGKGDIHFYFATPAIPKQIETLIHGAVSSYKFYIAGDGINATFRIASIEVQPEPDFTQSMKYKMLSSTVVSLKNGNSAQYLQPHDRKTIDILKKNLLWKYEIIHDRAYDSNIEIEFDEGYLAKRKRVSKLTTIKSGRADETKIRSFLCPIKITATPAMHEVAYNCGIGSQNSLGFGMLGILEKEERK